MYTWPNFKTKKALREAFLAGEEITVWQPGPFAQPPYNGWHAVEGPHYPEPHTWYARVLVENNKVKGVSK